MSLTCSIRAGARTAPAAAPSCSQRFSVAPVAAAARRSSRQRVAAIRAVLTDVPQPPRAEPLKVMSLISAAVDVEVSWLPFAACAAITPALADWRVMTGCDVQQRASAPRMPPPADPQAQCRRLEVLAGRSAMVSARTRTIRVAAAALLLPRARGGAACATPSTAITPPAATPHSSSHRQQQHAAAAHVRARRPPRATPTAARSASASRCWRSC